MPDSTTEFANAIMSPKDVCMSRCTTARPKPFVVSNVDTKRYAPTRNKSPIQRLPLRNSPPASMTERSSVPHGTHMKQTSRNASSPTVIPKVESRRPLNERVPVPPPSKTAKAQNSLLLPRVPSANRPSPETTLVPNTEVELRYSLPITVPNKTAEVQKSLPLLSGDRAFVPEPLKTVQKSKESKFMTQRQDSVRWPQFTTSNEHPPRPSCIPRTRTDQSFVGATAVPRGEQGVTVNVLTTGIRKLGVTYRKPSVNIGTAKTTRRIKVSDTFVKNPVVASGRRTVTPTCNQRLTSPGPIAYSHAVKTTSHIAWSPPQSPVLFSSPSRSLTIIVDVDVKQIETSTVICRDETPSTMGDAPKLGVAGIPKGSCGHSESASSSPTLSPTTTVMGTPESSEETIVGLDGMAKTSTPTKEPYAGISHMVCDATIISPSADGTTSMATLAKLIDNSQASSPTKILDSGGRAKKAVSRAIELARAIFSPSHHTSPSANEAAVSKTKGTNVSRIQNLFVPPPDKDAKASKNPATQIEIEMLRARRKVAGGGVVDPRLDRFNSLAAMAIVSKLRTSSSGGPD